MRVVADEKEGCHSMKLLRKKAWDKFSHALRVFGQGVRELEEDLGKFEKV